MARLRANSLLDPGCDDANMKAGSSTGDPDWLMIPESRPFPLFMGDNICKITDSPPAPDPKAVILFGSPEKLGA